MNHPLIVAHIVQKLAPGGIETMALDLQRYDRHPHQIHIISLEGTEQSATEQWPRLTQHQNLHFLNKPAGWCRETLQQLKQLLKTLQVDAIHSHHIGPLIYGGIAAKLNDIRHVHTEHDAWHLHDKKRRLLAGAAFHLLRPTIVADAQLVSDNIQHYIWGLRPNVILNGIHTEQFHIGNTATARQRLSLPLNVPIIGCVARFNPVKRHDILLKALAQLPPEIHLALAGDGPLEEKLKRQTETLKLTKRVHFLGALNDTVPFYQAIDLFCLASEKEGLPLSPLEAQACGKAVVLTEVGGCREAVDPNSGLLVSPNDVSALAQALLKQMNKIGTNPSFCRTARPFIQQHCDLTRVIEQYYRLYLGQSLPPAVASSGAPS